MMQKPWVKVFIWFMTTFFFFLASGVIISIFKPGPSENEVMKFMSGMMSAMENSMMGVTMNVESNGDLRSLINFANSMAFPVIMISVIIGVALRLWQRRDKNV